jgi:hypothetical protein
MIILFLVSSLVSIVKIEFKYLDTVNFHNLNSFFSGWGSSRSTRWARPGRTKWQSAGRHTGGVSGGVSWGHWQVAWLVTVASTLHVNGLVLIWLHVSWLFYFILFYFILFYFILFYFILFYFTINWTYRQNDWRCRQQDCGVPN